MQHYSHKLLQISLPVSFNFLSFKLEAQIQSQKGPADKESSLPSAVSPVSTAMMAKTFLTTWPDHIMILVFRYSQKLELPCYPFVRPPQCLQPV